jgi:hypothetical protein
MPAPVRIAAIHVDRRSREPELLGDLSRVEPAALEPLDLGCPFRAAGPLDRGDVRAYPDGPTRIAGSG